MPPYQYTRIPEASDIIRLFRLLPNDDEKAEIRGEIFDYSLQESRKVTHPYEALSYVWGSSETPQSIFISEGTLQVTPNLHAALLHLRDCGLPRILWIDAICINQADDQEKAYQIQSMAKIYGKASQVVVWLGDKADRSDDALEAIRFGEVSENGPNQGEIEKAINALLRRQWFRRMWVRQSIFDFIPYGY